MAPASSSAGSSSASLEPVCPVTRQAVNQGWALALGCGGDDRVEKVAWSNGQIFFAATFSGTVTFGTTVFTAAGGSDVLLGVLDAAGNLLRGRTFGGATNERARGLGITSDGTVVLAGEMDGAFTADGVSFSHAGGSDLFVATLDTTLVTQRGVSFGTADQDVLHDVAVNASGAVALTGTMFSPLDFGNGPLNRTGNTSGYMAVLRNDLSLRWARSFGGDFSDDGNGVALDTAGNVLMAGTACDTVDLGGGTLTANTCTDGVLGAYSPSGVHQFSRIFGGGGLQEEGWKVAFDVAGNAYWLGWFTDTVDFGGGPRSAELGYDGVLVSFTSTGAYRWDRVLAGGSATKDFRALIPGALEGVVVVGAFTNSLSAGQPLTSTGGVDGFVTGFSANGGNTYARTLRGTSTQRALHAVEWESAGEVRLVVGGSFQTAITVGSNTTFNSAGGTAGFLWFLTP